MHGIYNIYFYMYTENNLSIYKYIDINILFLLYIIIETFGERADFSYDYTNNYKCVHIHAKVETYISQY